MQPLTAILHGAELSTRKSGISVPGNKIDNGLFLLFSANQITSKITEKETAQRVSLQIFVNRIIL